MQQVGGPPGFTFRVIPQIKRVLAIASEQEEERAVGRTSKEGVPVSVAWPLPVVSVEMS